MSQSGVATNESPLLPEDASLADTARDVHTVKSLSHSDVDNSSEEPKVVRVGKFRHRQRSVLRSFIQIGSYITFFTVH